MNELIDNSIKIAGSLQKLILVTNKSLTRDQIEENADNVLIWQTHAAKVRIDLEQEYRKKIVELEEKGLSHASAENRARTEKEYALFKKIELIYSLAEEKVRIAKIKLGTSY